MTELCTESSYINPGLGPGLLLSLPPMSLLPFCLCFCHSVSCSCCLSLLLPHLSLSAPFSLCPRPLLSCPPNYSTLQISSCLALLSLETCNTCVTCLESVPLTSTGDKCHFGNETSGNNIKRRMLLRLQGCGLNCVYMLCLCVTGDSEGREKGKRLSRWVFGWNMEPFPGQPRSIPMLAALTTLMSTVKHQKEKCV